MHATGISTVLANELNANLANWEKYAAEWNAVKRIKLIVHKVRGIQKLCGTFQIETWTEVDANGVTYAMHFTYIVDNMCVPTCLSSMPPV